MEHLVLEVMLAISFEHRTAQPYQDKWDKNLQKRETLLGPAIKNTPAINREKIENDNNEKYNLDFHKILGKKPAAVNKMETNMLLTQVESKKIKDQKNYGIISCWNIPSL